jgi:hypothetical protein
MNDLSANVSRRRRRAKKMRGGKLLNELAS